ncbi:hypothetical protein DH2020_007471 [Rehmannia glutinosa]|uniref:RING-type E3 ubiquitin transferase n=1 Tax=Rehmannia glutinosa TaxID=99300 RepID=A0ABR0TYH8_REHGL
MRARKKRGRRKTTAGREVQEWIVELCFRRINKYKIMAGNYRFEMEHNDIVSSLITTVGSFIQDRLIDKHQRTQHKEQCSERLAAENDVTPDKDTTEARYSDQAVLANLDWGIDALEEAINTSNIETKMARLDYAEKMLQAEQAERIHELEGHYGQSLDENTRLYAKYYKDCMNYDSATSKKVIPMMPIVEPPMSPVHEFSGRSIPDYVKFGPILPKSAGFSPVMKSKDCTRDDSRMKATSTSENLDDSAGWDALEKIPEGCEDSTEDADAYMEAKYKSHENVSNTFHAETDGDTMSVASNRSLRHKKDEETTCSRQQRIKVNNSQRQSPQNSSPLDSPKTPSTKTSSPKTSTSSGKTQTSMLRLLSTRAMESQISNSQPVSPLSCNDNSSISSTDSDGEITGQLKTARRSVGHAQSVRLVFPKSSLNHGDDGNLSYASSPTSEVLTPQSRPPKDFVCPITGQIFNDPVTLETGQTYERKAIQEWMNRGNTTCPITRQPLSASSLPKTNYVLKRLITSWKDQHPDLAQEFSCTETPKNCLSSSNISSQRSISNEVDYKPQRIVRPGAGNISKQHLQECEGAILTIAKIWEDSNVASGINSYLSSPTIVNGFVEVLSASLNKDVLRTTVYILSKLICEDDRVGDLLTSIDSDFYCLADLLKKGLSESAVLALLLRPSFSQLSSHNLVATLLHIISNKNDGCSGFQYVIAPKDAAIALLEQIVVGGDESDRSHNAMNVITGNGIPALLNCLDRVDGRQSIVSILLCCIRVDITCKNVIANRIELSHVLELFHGGNDSVRGICIEFLCELVQLSRYIAVNLLLKQRKLGNQILQIIKEEGTFSTMHTLLVYLQMSPMEQKPAIATLLLQLDLLVAPRKMSIYREEAMEALLEALQRKDFPSSQITALAMLSSLSGHFRASKKPYMESWLLKIAGFDQPYNAMIRVEEMKTNETELAEMKEDEKAARAWEKRMAFVLSNHEKGAIFKALEECFKSNSIEIAKNCLVVATWLVHMLYRFPDCGIREVARKSLLDKFINVLQSSKNVEEKILAALALRGFAELWSCVEGPETDVSMNGEILSMLHIRNRLISSHSDGTIKVWDTGKRVPRLIQEAREHSKAVTCLYVPPSLDKLYSGSLDKTIRVWSIKQEEIHCIQVHDVKEAVLVLTANASVACFSSQANGVKVYNWSGVPRNINFSKQVKCLMMDGDKLYCGCSGYAIQVFKLSSKAVIGSLPTGLDIQHTTVNNDFIFTATKMWNHRSMAKRKSDKECLHQNGERRGMQERHRLQLMPMGKSCLLEHLMADSRQSSHVDSQSLTP